jgi:hypothetical protein
MLPGIDLLTSQRGQTVLSNGWRQSGAVKRVAANPFGQSMQAMSI